MQIKVLISTISERLSQVLCQQLMQEDSAGLACEVASLPHVLANAAVFKPDVLMIEASSAATSVAGLLHKLRQVSPSTRTLMLYDVCTHDLILDSIRQGASGCLLKSSDAALCAKAVRTVHRGDAWYARMALLQALQSQICAPLQSQICGPSRQREEIDEAKLTRREEEILDLIGSGLSNKEIGRRLEISDKTVKTHLHRIYVKVNQSGRYKAFLTQPESRVAIDWRPEAK